MTTIKLRRGTAAEWTASNPVLDEGEPGYEKDTGKYKLGDGKTMWNQLPYFLSKSILDTVFSTKAELTAVSDSLQPSITAALAANSTVVNAAAAAVTTNIGSRSLVETTDARLSQPAQMEDRYVRAWMGLLNMMALGIKPDGTVHAPLLESGRLKLSRLNDTELVATNSVISGMLKGTIDSNGRMAEDVIGEDGQVPAWILNRWANRMPAPAAPVPTTYKSTYKSDVIPIVSGPDMIAWGDSLTGASVWHAKVAQLTGRTVRMGGVGGEAMDSIAARIGSQPMLMDPFTIPADLTAVQVTPRFATGGVAYPLLQGAGGAEYPGGTSMTMAITVSGVPGKLTLVKEAGQESSYIHNNGDAYFFSRTTAGASVANTRPVPFYTDFSVARRDDIALYWIGRNGVTDTDNNFYGIEAAVQHLRPLHKRYLVLSVTNGTGEGTGTATYNSIAALNNRLRQRFGRRFVDVRSYLIKYGLQDAGITANAQDTADIAADTIPQSLRADTIHLITAAYNVVGTQVANRLTELGWV